MSHTHGPAPPRWIGTRNLARLLILCAFCITIFNLGCGRPAAPGADGSPGPVENAKTSGASVQAEPVRVTPLGAPAENPNTGPEAATDSAPRPDLVDKARRFGWSIASGLVAR